MERSRGHFEAPTISTIKCDVAEKISLMVGENVRWKRSLNVLCYPSAMNQDGFLPSIHFGDSLIAIRDRCRVISNSLSRKSLKLRHMIKERRVWDTSFISCPISLSSFSVSKKSVFKPQKQQINPSRAELPCANLRPYKQFCFRVKMMSIFILLFFTRKQRVRRWTQVNTG